MEEAVLEREQSEEMADFIEEITKLKEEKARLGRTVHLRDVEPSELTEADLRLWETYKNGEATEDDIRRHQRKTRLGGRPSSGYTESSFEFKAYIVNLETRRQLTRKNGEAADLDKLEEAA